MRVLITGATGFVGRAVAMHLHARGLTVLGAARHAADGPWDDFLVIDVTQTRLPTLPKMIDVVVHAAGLAHELAGPANAPDAHHQVNAIGSRRIAELAAAAGVRRFIMISSVKAMAETTTGSPLTEVSRCLPTSAYGCAKLEAERLVTKVLDSTPITSTILRLTPVYGPGSKGNLVRLVSLASRPWFPRLPAGRGARSMIHIDDVTAATELSITSDVTGVFIVDDGNTYSPRDIQNHVRAGLGTPANPVTLTPTIVRTMAAIGDLAHSGCNAGLFGRSDASRLLNEAKYHGEALRDQLRFEPQRTLWSTIEAPKAKT